MSAGLKDVLIRYLQNDNPGDKTELKQYIDFGKFQSFKKRVVRNFNQQKGENMKALEYNNKSFKEAYANPESRDLISNIIRDLPMGYKSESPPPSSAMTEDGADVTGSGSSGDPYLQTARVPKYLEKNVNKQIARRQKRMAMEEAQQADKGQSGSAKQLQPIQKAPVSGKGSATVTPVAQPATQSQPAQIPVQPQPAQIPVQPQPAQIPVQPQATAKQGPVQPAQQLQMQQGQTQSIAQQQADAQIQAVAKAQQMQLQQAQQLLQLQQQHNEQQQAQGQGQIVQPVPVTAQPMTAQVKTDQRQPMNSASAADATSDVGTKRKADNELGSDAAPAPISNAMPTSTPT